MATKLIVTNKKVLRRKYGNHGWQKIEDALNDLISADKERGLLTRWVPMDLKSGVKDFNAPVITDPEDPVETKTTIDALCTKAKPDYLMILGAPDVVPHQSLSNPIKDEDVDVPSDLPYACNGAHSEEPADFTGPTRVVGRLPDVYGASDPEAILKVLNIATNCKSRNVSAYKSYYALTAFAWIKSTRKTAQKAFGSSKVKFVSPSDGQPWSKTELQPRLHLINCHGADSDTWFYGDDTFSADFPTIHSNDYDGRLREGTVVAAECCYGAQLFDPDFLQLFDPQAPNDHPICNKVLQEGAYGMLGSTNIAYGPADDNDKADLVCLYFLRNVQRGASLGRALLEARQEYVANASPLDPVDLKTLAQFNLLGDPSVHPTMIPATVRDSMAKSRRVVSGRRKALQIKGRKIGVSLAKVYAKSFRLADSKSNAELYLQVEKRLTEKNLTARGRGRWFSVQAAKQPALAKSRSSTRKSEGGGNYYIFEASRPSSDGVSASSLSKVKKGKTPGPDAIILAKESSGIIESIRTLYRR